jgi:hypothetical protein
VKTFKITSMLLFIMLYFLLAILSCDKKDTTGPGQNQPPIIASLTANPSDVDWSATSQLVVIATDPEKQVLTYCWTSTGGVFITPTTKDTVIWQAPDSSGSFICSVTVSDGKNTVSKNITLTVTEHPVLSIDQDSLIFGATTEILNFTVTNIGTGVLTWSVNATTDDEGTWISSVTPSNGSTPTDEHEQVAVEVDRSGLEIGTYYGWVKVTSNDGNDSLRIIMDVLPPYDFFDDFSQGDANWTFGGCTHSITNEELTMLSNTYYQATAQSFTFSPNLDIPWVCKGDVTIVSSSTDWTDNGISVHINDSGMYAVDYMWLSVRKNSSSINWIWLWWVPSLDDEWLPWDENCYGYSSYVHTDDQKNTLEMSVSSDERFTLKADDHTLLLNNDAVNDMESMAGVDITLKVVYVKLRGGTGTTTVWDNIIFDSETSQLAEAQKVKPLMRPSDEYVDGILDRIAQGEDVTLKSLLKKKLNK